MSKQLPPKPHLRSLQNQAKQLQRAVRSGRPDAVARLRAQLDVTESTLSLRDAQQVIAREYGFEGWVDLRRHVQAATTRPVPSPAQATTSLTPYYDQAADLLRDGGFPSADEARHEVARRHGFRTWWRLVAAVDAARKAAVSVRPFPTNPRHDFKAEARELAREARRGSAEHLQRFRAALLHLAEASDAEIIGAANPRQARYVLEVEYGDRQLNPRQSPARRREWMERVWEGHDGSSRRKRAEMSRREQAFVEAATGDHRLPDDPDLSRLQELLDEEPSLIQSVGSVAVGRALGWPRGAPILRWLLEKGARYEQEPGVFGPLDGAVWTDCVENVRLLLEAQDDIDVAAIAVEPPHGGLASHRSLLHTAAWLAHVDMTALLLEHGAARAIEAKLGESGQTALQRAAINNWPRADPFARRDPNGRTNHKSAREVADLLLAHGAYYDIHSASAFDDAARVEALLKQDASLVDAVDGSGYTPLHWAANQGAVKAARVLLDAGADVNADSNSEKTPLVWAATAHGNMPHLPSNVDLMALLIERGADVDAQDSKGRTPLFHACQGGYDLNAEFLIVLGAKTTIRNRKGKSPLEAARKACIYMKDRG